MNEYNEFDESEVDEPIPVEEVVTANAFVGKIPLDVLLGGIDAQFNDYIELTDRTNYVEIFYKQLDASYDATNEEDEEHPAEIKEYLKGISREFINHMIELFDKKLALHIADSESDNSIDEDTIRRIFHAVYEGMILNAKQNFMTAITKDVIAKINTQVPREYTDDQWYDAIHQMLEGYSPIVVDISPIMFLKYIGNDELLSLYEDEGLITGNFLRKYSPRLDQNTEFEIELVSNITLTKDVKEDLYASTNSTGKQPD